MPEPRIAATRTSRFARASSSVTRARSLRADDEGDLVEVAPRPVLARLHGLDDGVVRGRGVLARVPVGRRVAAADLSTRHAHPEVYPAATGAEAFRAPLGAGRFDGADLIEVRACCAHASIIPKPSSVAWRRVRERGRQPVINPLCRYAPLGPAFEEAGGAAALSILDVGSGPRGLAYAFDDVRFAGLDVAFVEPPAEHMVAVRSSGALFPFADASFDVVV